MTVGALTLSTKSFRRSGQETQNYLLPLLERGLVGKHVEGRGGRSLAGISPVFVFYLNCIVLFLCEVDDHEHNFEFRIVSMEVILR